MKTNLNLPPMIVPSKRDFLWRVVAASDYCLIDSSDGVTASVKRVVAYSKPSSPHSPSSRWSAALSPGSWCVSAMSNSVKFQPLDGARMKISTPASSEEVRILPSATAPSARHLWELSVSEKIRWDIGLPKFPQLPSADLNLSVSSPLISVGVDFFEMRYGKNRAVAPVKNSPFPVKLMVPPWEFSILWEFVKYGNFCFLFSTKNRPCCLMRDDNAIFFLPFRHPYR